jgi:hypothetical protein
MSVTTFVKSPRKLDNELLAAHVQAGMVKAFAELKPFIEELWKRFDALNDYETIAGCKTRKEYCAKVLDRTPRAVQYMMAGGNPVIKRKPAASETVSLPRKEKPIKEYASLIEAVPDIRTGRDIVPPSQYGVAEIEESVTKFTVNLAEKLSTPDKKIVYRSLIKKFEDLLKGLS